MSLSKAQRQRALYTQALLIPEKWRYGQCEAHVPHYSKASAKRAIREHLRLPCRKCWSGRPIEMFVCPTSPNHRHIGHGQRREVAS